MKLIVGLGNPGREYQNTRHNCGFIAVDKIALALNISIEQSKFKGLIGKTKINGEDVILLKPQTYMNLSGESIVEAMRFFKLKSEDILVIYDDMDLPVGKMRLRLKGSPGGHNGIKNIIQHLHTDQFLRAKIGIGRDIQMMTVDYVLSKFNKEDMKKIEDAATKSVEIAKDFIANIDPQKIVQKYSS